MGVSRKIVWVIIDDLKDRSGFRGFWDCCDDDTKNEIINDLEDIVRQILLDSTFEKI